MYIIMAFDSKDISVIVFVILFAILNLVLCYFGNLTQFTIFNSFVISIFIATFAVFQLIFYSMVETKIPSKMVSNLLKFFLQVIPNSKNKINSAVKLTADQYASKLKQMNQDNTKAIKSSALFLFVICAGSMTVLFLVLHYVLSYRPFTKDTISSLGVWMISAIIHLILFFFVIQQHNYVYKTQLFGYGLEVLRSSIMQTIITQAAATDDQKSAIPVADLEKIQTQLQRIIQAQKQIDLSVDTEPAIQFRLRDPANRYVLVLGSLSVIAVLYTVYRLISTGDRGGLISFVLFAVIISFYMWLYTHSDNIDIKSSLNDPDMMLYELSTK